MIYHKEIQVKKLVYNFSIGETAKVKYRVYR